MTKYYISYNSLGEIVARYDSDINMLQISNLPQGESLLEVDYTVFSSTFSGGWSVSNGQLVAPASPTSAQLLEKSKTDQSGNLRQSYQKAISTCPVTINGTAYTLALDTANATLNLSAALSAQQALAAPAWTADADVVAGQLCTVSGVPLFCSKPGKTGSVAPTVPTAIGTPVTDGTAAWELFARSAECTNGTFEWFTAAEIVSVGQQIELFLHQQKGTLISLLSQVQAAATVADVQAVIWS